MTEEMPDWERRFRAPRVGLPDWARDRPDRAAVVATANGVLEVHSWDHSRNVLVQATRRKEGTAHATIDPGGEWLWWFDDERRRRVRRLAAPALRGGPGRRRRGPHRPARRLPVRPCHRPRRPRRRRARRRRRRRADPRRRARRRRRACSTRTARTPASATSPRTATLVAIAHSEHGDSRHPALRVVRARRTARRSRELWDGPGQGPAMPTPSPRSPATPGCWWATSGGAAPEPLIWDVGDRRAAGARARRRPARSRTPTGTSTRPRCSSPSTTTRARACTATTSPAAPPGRRSGPPRAACAAPRHARTATSG